MKEVLPTLETGVICVIESSLS